MQFREAALLPQSLNSILFDKNYKWSITKGSGGVKKKQPNTLISAFEVIVRPRVHLLFIALFFHFQLTMYIHTYDPLKTYKSLSIIILGPDHLSL